MGLAFLLTQVIEYLNVGFNTGDGAFASVFFGLTGLHGAHVFIGLTLLGDGDRPRASAATSRRSTTTASSFPGSTGTSSTSCGSSSTRRSTCSERASRGEPIPERGGGVPLPAASRSAPSRSSCVASWIDRWLGVAVWLLLTAAAVVVYLRQRGPRPPREHVEHVGPPDERRVLVVANETVGGEELMQRDRRRSRSPGGRSSTSSALRSTLASRPGRPTRIRRASAAQKRLDATLARLAAVGIEAQGDGRRPRSAASPSRTRSGRSTRTRS